MKIKKYLSLLLISAATTVNASEVIEDKPAEVQLINNSYHIHHNINTVEFNDEIKESFKEFVINIKNIDEIVKNDPFTAANMMGNKLKEILPNNILDVLNNMGKTGEPGIIYLKGLPQDKKVPLEGTIDQRAQEKGKVSDSLILGLANLMGCEVKSSKKEQNGRLIHNIAPVKGFENTKSSQGKDPFYLHTENAYEETPPDFLILYGLVGDPKALTTYHFITDFIDQFPKHIINSMKKKQFKIVGAKGYTDAQGVFSLLSEEKTEEETKIRLRLYQNPRERIEAASPEVEQEVENVLQYVEKIVGKIKPEGLLLNPGEAIIFNNGWGINKISGIMHGRGGEIQNPYRWLQRAFLFQNNSK